MGKIELSIKAKKEYLGGVKTTLQIGILFCFTAVLFSCNTTRVVKPLDKGETRISADLGGPIIGFPVPLSSISVAHGLNEKLSVFGGFHTTTLAWHSLQFDLGANYSLLEPTDWKPGITGNFILNPIISLRDGKSSLFPELGASFYWELSEKHIPYVGVTNWFDVGYNSTELEKGKLFHPAIGLGYNYEATNWIFGLESKWINLNKQLHIPQVEHTSIGGNGAVGLYFKAAYRFRK